LRLKIHAQISEKWATNSKLVAPRVKKYLSQTTVKVSTKRLAQMTPKPRPDVSQASPRCLPSLAQMIPKPRPDVSQASPRWLISLAQSLRLLSASQKNTMSPLRFLPKCSSFALIIFPNSPNFYLDPSLLQIPLPLHIPLAPLPNPILSVRSLTPNIPNALLWHWSSPRIYT